MRRKGLVSILATVSLAAGLGVGAVKAGEFIAWATFVNEKGVGLKDGIGYGLKGIKPWDMKMLESLNIKPKDITNKKTFEVYGTNIAYHDFSSWEISQSKKEIKLPKDIAYLLAVNGPNIQDKQSFRQDVMDAAHKLGYSEDMISQLSPKEAIMLAVDITAERITYRLVDNDKEFIIKHGSFLPHDVYFSLGEGDCDKYSAITSAIFSLFREINPKLQNVYMADKAAGGKGHLEMEHSWNSILVLEGNTLNASHIDPTFYDSQNDHLLDAGNEHVNKFAFAGDLYQGLNDPNSMLVAYSRVLEGSKEPLEREWAYRNISKAAFLKGDIKKVLEIEKEYSNEGLTENLEWVLYFSIKTIEAKGKDSGNRREKVKEAYPKFYELMLKSEISPSLLTVYEDLWSMEKEIMKLEKILGEEKTE